MNKVILMGRLTRDPEVRYSQGDNASAVARYTLAVDRRFKRDGEQTTDFINCVAFGKTAEFFANYFSKGDAVEICGSIQTGKYEDSDGKTIYTTDIIADAVILDAKAKLHNSELTVQEISNSLNFPNPSFFGRYFKRHTGYSPMQYRELT